MKSLRAHLVLLVLGAALPLLVFAAAMMQQHLSERREIIERGTQATARALALAVEGEVKASLATLHTLSSSPLLDAGNLKSFHELCVRATQGRKSAYAILFDAAGKPLLNSSRPFGAELPSPLQSSQPPGFDPRYPEVPMGGAENVRKVLATGKPFVSNLFVSLVTHEPRVGLDIPVIRDGALRYVLELSVDPVEFNRLLAGEATPHRAIASIVDRQGIVVGTSATPAKVVGKPFAVDAGEVHHVAFESPLTGWKTSLTVPRDAAYAPLGSAMTALAIGALAAILAAVVAAVVLGRRITRLVDSAPAERERAP